MTLLGPHAAFINSILITKNGSSKKFQLDLDLDNSYIKQLYWDVLNWIFDWFRFENLIFLQKFLMNSTYIAKIKKHKRLVMEYHQKFFCLIAFVALLSFLFDEIIKIALASFNEEVLMTRASSS